jgi:hypothetical protein
MRCIRAILMLMGTVATVLVSEGQFGQPRATRELLPIPLASTLLDAIDDANLIAELKLTDEQVKKLATRRQEVWEEQFTTGKDKFAESAASRADDTDKILKKVMTAEQYKRAQQIAAQHLTEVRLQRPQVRISTLKTHPELIEGFQLTNEQKQKIDNAVVRDLKGKGNVPSAYVSGTIQLDAKQIMAMKEFLGPAFSKVLVHKTDPRLENRAKEPQTLHLLAARDVRDELDLSSEQSAKFAELRQRWTNLNQIIEYSPKTLNELATKLTEESEKSLAGTLSPEQRTRLKQLYVQQFYGHREIDFLCAKEYIIRELAITEEQTGKFMEIWTAFRKEATLVVEEGDSLEAIEKKITELSHSRHEKAKAVLTADQLAKFSSLFGEVFIGRYLPDRESARASNPFQNPDLNPGMPPRNLMDRAQDMSRTVSFGRYSTELTYLTDNRSIQREMKMTKGQIQKAREAKSDIEMKFMLPNLPRPGFGKPIPEKLLDEYSKKYEERSKAIESEIETLLSAEQARRFREIMLQVLKHTADIPPGLTSNIRPMTISHPIRYPGVAEAVKLTDKQKQQLISKESLDDVLTRDQRKAIAKMLGEPFKGSLREIQDPSLITQPLRPVTPTRRVIPPPLITLSDAAGKKLDEVLKLTAEQSKTINKALGDFHSTLDPDSFPTASERRLAEEAFMKAVTGVLTADQEKRVAQLVIQLDAATSLSATFTTADMAKKLELTDQQIELLNDVEEDASRVQLLIRTEQIQAPQQQTALRIKGIADKEMFAVLTDSQRAKWKELTGEPCKEIVKGQAAIPKGQ